MTVTLAGNNAHPGTGQWTVVSGASGAFANPTDPATIFYGVPGTTYTLRWTTSSIYGTCSPTSDEVEIQLDQSPTPALAGPDQSLCGAPTTLLAANTPVIGTGEWSIISGADGVIADIDDPNTSFDGVAGTTYILRWTITNGTCQPSYDDVVIELKSIPDALASSATICSRSSTNIAISNPNAVPGTTFSWVVQSVSNVTGAFAGNGDVISQVLKSTDGTTQGTVTYRITPTAQGCAGTPVDVIVTVDPVPVINTPASNLSAVICSDETLNFTPTATVVGTTYSWTATFTGSLSNVSPNGIGPITDTPVNSASTPGVITYVITPEAQGCAGNPVNYVVTVRPRPDVLATDEEICAGQSTTIAITNPNGVAGTTYSWVVFSSTNVSGAAPGTGNYIGQTLTTVDGVTPGTVVYRITPIANGCEGDYLDVTVDVSPVPVFTNDPIDFSLQICSEESLNFLPSSTIVGTTYTWTAIGGGLIDPASITTSGSGAITDTPINTGNVSTTVTYRITPTYNGCSGTPVNLVVTVKPLPSASASDLTICSGQTAVVTIDATPRNVSGTNFSWTALASANLIGAVDGNGSTISQVLSTTDALVGTVDYTITPFANGCAGPVHHVTATVNPIATVDAGPDFAVCEPAEIQIPGTIGGSATMGTWSMIQGAGSVSASTTTGTDVTATYTVGAGDIGGTVILRLTTDDPDAGGPCSIVSDDITITVNQAPRVTVPADFTVCEPLSIPLTGDLDPSATAGSWSVLSGAGVLSVSSITGDMVTASYAPAPSDVGGTVSFRLTTNDPDGFGPCAPATDDITITINESAKVDAGLPQVVCEDEVVTVTGSISGTTTSVLWSGGSGTARFTDATHYVSDYNLTPADIAAGTITLTLTTNDPDGAGPCVPSSDNVLVTINKLPLVALSPLASSYAENADPVTLDGFPNSPPGIYTGPGILAGTNQFYPSNAGIGSKVLTYTYTDLNGCTNSASRTTTVNPVTQIDFVIAQPSEIDELGRLVICENSGTNNLLRIVGIPEWNDSASKQDETFFRSTDPILGPRIVFDGTSFLINTKNLPGGEYEIQYVFTNTLEATETLTKTLKVNSAPKAIIDVPNSCIEDVITFTDASIISNNSSGGAIDRWSWSYGEGGNTNDGFSQNPTYQYIAQGLKTLGLRVTTDQGCAHDTTRVIRISSPPRPDFSWSKICVGTQTTEFRDLSNPGIANIVQYSWDFADGDTLGFGGPGKTILPGTHGGKTSNTYKDPHHKYDEFQVYQVRLAIRTDDGCENTVTKRVFILDYSTPTSSAGYYENFEAGRGTWVETSSHRDPAKAGEYSWVFGTPSGEKINRAYSGVNAWWTGGNPNPAADFSTYYRNDSTEVTGPCLDLSGIERPMISLNYWSHSQEVFDGAVVQYSTNGGSTWRTIGDAERRGINWYNSKNLPGSIGGEDRFAWSGKTNGWRNARFNLDEIPPAERGLVVFRIAFGSNSDNQPDSVLNGFAFDDVYIGEKKRTVLVEQFVNSANPPSDAARSYLDNLYDNQTAAGLKSKSDFLKIQYHIAAIGAFDQLYDDNTVDPTSRALIYKTDTPPATVMDGILGPSPYQQYTNLPPFNGDHALVTATEIDRRALDDPKFSISVAVDMAQSSFEPLTASLVFTYLDSMQDLSSPVALHAALVEGNISGNRNVLRKLLLGSGGRTETRVWSEGDQLTVPINYMVDVPISDPDNLYLIVFVQDRLTNHILQSAIAKMPAKEGAPPVGIVDNPMDAEIRGIRVYPNPASRYVNFALENPLTRDYEYRIIDQRGVTILEGALNHDLRTPQEVELTQLSNGIYFVQFRIAGRMVVYRKIAVMNR